MAVEHQKKAGQRAKNQARRMGSRIVGGIMLLMLLIGGLIGSLFARFYFTSALILSLALLIVVLFAMHKLTQAMDRWAIERLRFLHGGQAEGLVAWHLKKLPNDWHVFHNLKCARGGDVDHVVVGPTGVFVISTKSYKGHVTRNTSGTIRLNGVELTDLAEAMNLAMWVRDLLKSTLGKQMPWIQPVLALPLTKVDIPAEKPVWVLGEDDLLDVLEAHQSERKLPRERIEQIASELDRVADRNT